MKETVKNVKVQQVWRHCDNGCEGDLKYIHTLSSYPTQYVYICPVCRTYYNTLEKYPLIRYIEIEESEKNPTNNNE